MNILDAIQSYMHVEDSQRPDAISLDDLQAWANELEANIHVAIMTEPYLSKVLSGEKYIESRLTKVNIPPFERASAGDVVLFKRSGGAILAMTLVERVKFEHLTPRKGPCSLAERYSDGPRLRARVRRDQDAGEVREPVVVGRGSQSSCHVTGKARSAGVGNPEWK